MFPPCSVDDADDEAFNLPVAAALPSANSKDNVSGSRGGVARNVDGDSRFGPRCSADDGARAASRDACHALP